MTSPQAASQTTTGTGDHMVAISAENRDRFRHDVDHICHMLSEQGPMSITFVHNNRLLGLQDLHFEEAIKKAEQFLDGRGYLPNAAFRAYFAQGRITHADLDYVLPRRKDLQLDHVLSTSSNGPIATKQIIKLHLIHGITAMTPTMLKFSAEAEHITRKFPADIPTHQQQELLKFAAENLDTSREQIGVTLTMAEWLQEYFNYNLLGTIRDDVLKSVKSCKNLPKSADPFFHQLGISGNRRAGYLARVRQHVSKFVAEKDLPLASNLWLRIEQQEIAAFARRNFDTGGSLDDLMAYFETNLETYAALGIWAACLKRFNIQDSFSAANKGADGADQLAEDYRVMESWGGPPIALDPDLQSEVTELIHAELDHLATLENSTTDARERAHLCWIVLHDLGDAHLHRRGFEALGALNTGDKTGRSAQVLAKVEALDPRPAMWASAAQMLADDITALSTGKSHADMLQSLTGEDVVERVNDYMIGLCSAFLDEGLAAWHLPGRALGFYDSWRNMVKHDRTFDIDGLSGWRDAAHRLPVVAVDAVIWQLQSLGIPEPDWANYCGRLLADLKGWAGMVFWRQTNPNYDQQQAFPIDVMQYLAVRLFYQNQLLTQLCRTHWQLSPNIAELEQYFSRHLAEYMLRKQLYAGHLPEHLAAQTRRLASPLAGTSYDQADQWKTVADMAWRYAQTERREQLAADQAWRLSQLAQFLGWNRGDIEARSDAEITALIACLDGFSEDKHGPIWLLAFENNYRNEICNAMALNRGRGRWMTRDRAPKSQVIFCIDEREESIHRHYEELDPEHETMGAAGFFGVAMDYAGLDEHSLTPLCPAVVTPANTVHEVARPADEQLVLPTHKRRTKWLEVFHDTFWELKRNVLGNYFLIDLVGFLHAVPLVGRVFFPVQYVNSLQALHKLYVPPVKTHLALTQTESSPPGHGFTTDEQADRVEGLLRNIGLIANFAPIVVFCAHGSHSENNPHENAHDCGACGGKHGAPNSRAVAAMANTPIVRELLTQRGITIPEDTWFIGATHNTATDLVSYFDEEDVPAALSERFQAVKVDLLEASMRAARERCRRFASAPKDASLAASFHHTHHRAYDFSQVRPEWGHATNAFAVVGRRGVTQGVFFDRRPFIISYDPTTDPTGNILERILLAVGPVGAGINLEYYFSTVDAKVYGCDTKVPHNVTGLVGVMEGAQSDLRTGLPSQMTEVHEAMRLHLVVDAPMEVLGEIYGRQPGIQQLLDGEWVILIAHDPETGAFNQFVPGVGFEQWDDTALEPIPQVSDSYHWFKGKYEHFLPPAQIAEPTRPWRD